MAPTTISTFSSICLNAVFHGQLRSSMTPSFSSTFSKLMWTVNVGEHEHQCPNWRTLLWTHAACTNKSLPYYAEQSSAHPSRLCCHRSQTVKLPPRSNSVFEEMPRRGDYWRKGLWLSSEWFYCIFAIYTVQMINFLSLFPIGH